MGYHGRLYLTTDNYPRFKQIFTDLMEVGYQVEIIQIDRKEFGDFNQFEQYLFSIRKAYRIKIKLKKNDNTIEYRNQWYNKRKWNHYVKIENEYDVVQDDMMKITLKYDEFKKTVFKDALIRDSVGYFAFIDTTIYLTSLLILQLLFKVDVLESFIFSAIVLLLFWLYIIVRPVYRNKTKTRNRNQ